MPEGHPEQLAGPTMERPSRTPKPHWLAETGGFPFPTTKRLEHLSQA